MQVLIGTTNPAKAALFERLLAGTGASVVTPDALGIAGEPEETGTTPAENARIKAAFYARFAPRVVCADSGLYLDALPLDDPRQPGLHVRTPRGGERLDDEAMIAYYAALAHALGGWALAYYLDGFAAAGPHGVKTLEITREEAREAAFILLDKPCAQRRAGWPLDSLSQDLSGRGYFDPARREVAQQERGYLKRLRPFLIETLEL